MIVVILSSHFAPAGGLRSDEIPFPDFEIFDSPKVLKAKTLVSRPIELLSDPLKKVREDW